MPWALPAALCSVITPTSPTKSPISRACWRDCKPESFIQVPVKWEPAKIRETQVDIDRTLPATYSPVSKHVGLSRTPSKHSPKANGRTQSAPLHHPKGQLTRSRYEDQTATLYQTDFCKAALPSTYMSSTHIFRHKRDNQATSEWALLESVESAMAAAERAARQQLQHHTRQAQKTFLDGQVIAVALTNCQSSASKQQYTLTVY